MNLDPAAGSIFDPARHIRPSAGAYGPTLDNVPFRTVLEQAIDRIPVYCPEWTNPVPGDPGTALIELFAWLTEATVYRIDRIIPAAAIALLETLGCSRRPAEPSSAVVAFTHSACPGRIEIPAGTRLLSSKETGSLEFETTRRLIVRNTCLAAVASHDGTNTTTAGVGRDGVLENLAVPASEDRRIRLLAGLSDTKLVSNLTSRKGGMMTISLSGPVSGNASDLEWCWFDGSSWQAFRSCDRSDSGTSWTVEIPSCGMHEAAEVGIPGAMILCAEQTGHEDGSIEISRIEVSARSIGYDVVPESLECSDPAGRTRICATPSGFMPFGPEPIPGTRFTMRLPETAVIPGAFINIGFKLQGRETRPSDDLLVEWSCSWDGINWCPLGNSPGISSTACSPDGFVDETRGLVASGNLAFTAPDQQPNPEERPGRQQGFFVKALIRNGDFGRAGAWEIEGDRWSFNDSSPLKPPVIDSIGISVDTPPATLDRMLSTGGGSTVDHSDGKVPFKPFLREVDRLPFCAFGLCGDVGGGPFAFHVDAPGGLERTGRSELVARWEILTGKGWRALEVDDDSQGLSTAGNVIVNLPDQAEQIMKFGRKLVWIRCVIPEGGGRCSIRSFRSNTVSAVNATSVENRIIGSSSGLPNASFQLPAGCLEGEKIVVMEPCAVAPGRDEPVPVEWTGVSSLAWSGPEDRHYERIGRSCAIRFGDGIRGKIPPAGRGNIRILSCMTGGGSTGNIPTGSITSTDRPVQGIASVVSITPAVGGQDAETDEDLFRKAPGVLRLQSGCVTATDLAHAAKEGSRQVCRSMAFEEGGAVRVVVVPDSGAKRPSPSPVLRNVVREYLEKIRPVTVRIEVSGPTYRPVDVEIVTSDDCAAGPEKTESLRSFVESLLCPLKGGSGSGWPFGQPVTSEFIEKSLKIAFPAIGIEHVEVSTDYDVCGPAVLPDLRDFRVRTARGRLP